MASTGNAIDFGELTESHEVVLVHASNSIRGGGLLDMDNSANYYND